MVLDEFRTITASLAAFFQTTAGMLSGLGDIPHVEPPPERERPDIDLPELGSSGAGAGAGASTVGNVLAESRYRNGGF